MVDPTQLVAGFVLTLTDYSPSTRPSCVQQPHVGPVLLQLLVKHRGILHGVPVRTKANGVTLSMFTGQVADQSCSSLNRSSVSLVQAVSKLSEQAVCLFPAVRHCGSTGVGRTTGVCEPCLPLTDV